MAKADPGGEPRELPNNVFGTVSPERCSHPEIKHETYRGDELGTLELALHCPYCATGYSQTITFDP